MKTTRNRIRGWFATFSTILAALTTTAALAEPRELNVGITHDRYQDHFDAQVKREFRLLDIACYPVITRKGRERHFNVHSVQIWENRLSPVFRSQAGYVSADRVRTDSEKLVRSGFRMISINATASGDKVWHSVIWEQRPEDKVEYRWGISAKELETAAKDFTDRGWQPLCLTGVQHERKLQFTAAWEQRESPVRELEVGISTRRFPRDVKARRDQGFRLFDVAAYQQGRTNRIACIWEKSGDVTQDVQIVQTTQLSALNEAQEKQGLQPAQVAVYVEGFKPFAVVVWEKTN